MKTLEKFYKRYSKRMESLIDTMGIRGRTIIDLGCAIGWLTIPLAQRFPESRIIAIDLDKKDLAALKKQANMLGLRNITTRLADVRSLKALPDNSADFIVSNFLLSMLEKQSDLQKMFWEIYRVLKSKGATAHSELTTKTTTEAQRLLVLADTKYSASKGKWWEPGDVAATMRKAGFQKVSIKPFNWNLAIGGAAAPELLAFWSIKATYLKKYRDVVLKHGLEFPEGSIITGFKN